MALILPKGIVVNSPQIEGDIERIDSQPLDEADIAKVWKVYTTTQRRLLDPTAERLENLWWRIWGSRKKSLKGATVARLFAQISDGQSFVPLRGPPNRLEGNSPLTTNSRHGPGASSTNNIPQPPASSRPSTTSSSVASRAPGPMPHPILKKTRGPSSTGPRPTARFISPHESQDEAEPTSSISPNTHVTVQPPSPSPESQDRKTDKKNAAVQTKKTFVASKKKRPVIVRRQSSQTSQSSPEINTSSAGKEFESRQSSSAIPSSSERTPPTIAEHARSKTQSRFQENFSPVSKTSGGSSQSLKKPAPRSNDSKRLSQRKSASKGALSEAGPSGEPSSSKLKMVENFDEHVDELTAEELAVQKMLLQEANVRVQQQATQAAPRTPSLPESANEGLRILHGSVRSRSSASHGTEGSGAMGLGLGLLQHETKGVTSAAPTFTDASGQVNLGSVGHHQSYASDASTSRRSDKGKGPGQDEAQQSTIFAKRPVQPVQVAATPEASGPLSRSKSQLTLLLEKDRERSSGKKPEKDRSSGKKK